MQRNQSIIQKMNKVKNHLSQYRNQLYCKHRCQTSQRRNKEFGYLIKFNDSLPLIVASILIVCVLTNPVLGVGIEELKAPIKDLKDTIFKGWMWVPKIGAAVGGCLMAVYNQSVMPLATGAGIGLGIHFYDMYIKADGALI